MARKIDFYFSMQSPWAFIGFAPFHKVAAEHHLDVTYKPVVLGELFAETGGLPLAKRHPARQRYRLMELQRWREKRGMNFPIKPKHWPFDARRADGMIIAIVESGGNPKDFMAGVFKGIWNQETDLSDAATLSRTADDAGFDGAKLLARADTPDIAAKYEQNRQDAIEAGVFGSPAWVLDGEVFWGQDRIDLLADALKSGRRAYTSDV